MEHYDEQVEEAYQSILNNKMVTDLKGKKWKAATIELDDGDKMHIATDGNTVRIMTLNHLYVEIQLVVDSMYPYNPPPIPEDFIAKDEMQI